MPVRGKTNYMEIGSHQGMIANEHIKVGSVTSVANDKGDNEMM